MGPAEVCYAVFMSAVRIIQFTDPHLYGGEGESLRGVATLPALTAAMAHAHAHAWPPHALLVTGDLVQDDPSGYPHFRRLFGALGLPVLCLPGNHDEPEAMRRELDGARLLATPSTCAQFLPNSDDFAVDRRPPGYRTLELRPDGSLLTEVVWVAQHRDGSSRSACSAA